MPPISFHLTPQRTAPDITAQEALEIAENVTEWREIMQSIRELAEDGERKLSLSRLSDVNREKLIHMGYNVWFICDCEGILWTVKSVRHEVHW